MQAAAGELEQRIAEVQAQDEHLGLVRARIDVLADEALATARRLVAEPDAPRQARPLQQAAA